MSPRTIQVLGSIACAALLIPSRAMADEGAAPPSPPAGWEIPPPLSFEGKKDTKKPAKKKPALPECCGYDKLCCTRQADIDARVIRTVNKAIPVSWSDIPYVEVKRAPRDKPGIEGVPPARIINENGQLFPWPATPKGEVRFMPPGENGETLWSATWTTPYFGRKPYRGMGYGSVHYVGDKEVSPDKGASMLMGPAYYLSFAEGKDHKIIMDRVKGILNGTAVIQATVWAHAEAIAAVPTMVNVYKEKKDDRTGLGNWVWEKTEDDLKKMVDQFFPLETFKAAAALPECERVVFILPEVILGFESRDAKTDGGHFPDRRESAESYTRYTLPAAPGYSGWVTFLMLADLVKRWFPSDKAEIKLKDFAAMALSASQTEAEAEPRIRVFFLNN